MPFCAQDGRTPLQLLDGEDFPAADDPQRAAAREAIRRMLMDAMEEPSPRPLTPPLPHSPSSQPPSTTAADVPTSSFARGEAAASSSSDPGPSRLSPESSASSLIAAPRQEAASAQALPTVRSSPPPVAAVSAAAAPRPSALSPPLPPGSLLAAASDGSLAWVQFFLSSGASLDDREPGGTGFTALHAACQVGNTACALELIKAGADTSAQTQVRQPKPSAAFADEGGCIIASHRRALIFFHLAAARPPASLPDRWAARQHTSRRAGGTWTAFER